MQDDILRNILIGLVVAAFLGIAKYISDLMSPASKNRKEKKEFEKRIKQIPEEVIQVIKKGLDKNSLATKMHFGSKATKRDDVTGEPQKKEYYLEFGEYSEPISKELYDMEGDIEDFLVNNDFSQPTIYGPWGRTQMILNSDFLAKVDKCKWG